LFSAVINVINTRIIRVFGFTLAELLLEFLLQYIANAELYKNFLRTKIVEDRIKTILTKSIPDAKTLNIEKRYFKKQLVKIDAIRDLALNRRIEIDKHLAKKKKKDKSLSKIENLLRLYCYYLNNIYTDKLLKRFKELYRVAKFVENRKSVYLKNLNKRSIKKQYYINNTISF